MVCCDAGRRAVCARTLCGALTSCMASSGGASACSCGVGGGGASAGLCTIGARATWVPAASTKHRAPGGVLGAHAQLAFSRACAHASTCPGLAAIGPSPPCAPPRRSSRHSREQRLSRRPQLPSRPLPLLLPPRARPCPRERHPSCAQHQLQHQASPEMAMCQRHASAAHASASCTTVPTVAAIMQSDARHLPMRLPTGGTQDGRPAHHHRKSSSRRPAVSRCLAHDSWTLSGPAAV